MMLLKDLLAPWFHYSGSEQINGLCLDSRIVTSGILFVAMPGFQTDGRQYIAQAISAGAVAVVTHTDNHSDHGKVDRDGFSVPQIFFFQLNRQLSALAAQFSPLTPHKMQVVGITGTNGKTSISQIIGQLVNSLGFKSAVMGTLGNGMMGQLVDSGNTTADAITVMQQLADYERLNASVCAMEVSSHGLVQGRVEAVPFHCAVFSNLSRDHLDFHGDMQSYAAAKKRLFQFPSLQHGVINIDDAIGAQWLSEFNNSQFKSFSILENAQADFYCDNVKYHNAGVQARLHFSDINDVKSSVMLESPLLGAFNLSNLLAAVAGLHCLGYSMDSLVAAIPQLVPVAGRMERFSASGKATLVVDYAHTPDAIEKALQSLRVHCQGTLWCVFGCGGNRDKGKRPLMAQAAEQFADKIMVTSDNVRDEDPQDIINDVLAGLSASVSALVEVDRETAIRVVAGLAQPGDIVLLAGKGHETYQEIKGQRIVYDERALAATLMGVKI